MSIDLTLERIRAVYEHLPAYSRPTVHIAGTNGKGSVSAFVSSIINASGFSVGRFNSPHLLQVYDSIVLDNSPVDPAVYASVKDLVRSTAKQHDLSISSFEILTLTALVVFEQAKVDFVVMEVGMGGCLDATNVIASECIKVSALTAVDLDHQAFLGNTVEEIAKEKASIARPGKPFVLGHQNHVPVADVVQAVVSAVKGKLKSSLTVIPRPWSATVDGPGPHSFSLSPPWHAPSPMPIRCTLPSILEPVQTRLSLHGEHQLQNLGTAFGIIDALLADNKDLRQKVTRESIERGIESTTWLGRLSFHSVQRGPQTLPVLVDGAHNAASAITLGSYLKDLLSQTDPSCRVSLTMILALSRSPPKKPNETLSPLFPLHVPANVDVNVVVMEFSLPDGMPWIKCEEPCILQDVIQSLSPGIGVTVATEAGEAGIRAAFDAILGDEDKLVVIAGSLYLVADFYRFVNKN